jgi:quinol-cytochrome oxidoreductase complex cytochrome b subunit
MAKATPLVGAGGPFAKVMMFPGTDVPMIHAGSDARFFLLAGTFVGENALLRFYVLHCVFIPVIVTVLIAIHFWRIRKDGGISGPL